MSRHYIYLWTGIVIGIGGQALLKAGAGAPDFASQILSLTTVAGLACYGAATLMYMMAIRVIPIAVAFPSISMSYVVVLLVGATLFGEHLSAAKVAGVVMIGGLMTGNRYSSTMPARAMTERSAFGRLRHLAPHLRRVSAASSDWFCSFPLSTAWTRWRARCFCYRCMPSYTQQAR